ncbi:hypothetical protein [Leifsonia virtsii]|uniref:Glycosyltransferase family 1 protein n=1 Tax=Leifsonia virtsii TaxID=3035915 RepID=A0ABT8J022_9MICO|nr:hypothetical protein [Leifsonia virtsii]MDN4598390.1 hypothetical protein [Leifsonia virtsii]
MRRLVFLYAERFREAGSTVMRGFQLADIAREHLPRRRVSVRPLGSTARNSDVFLTKGAVNMATPEQLDLLVRSGNRLLFDPVDELPPWTTARFADVLVASSHTAFEHYSRAFPATRVALVDHHVDPRLPTSPAPPSRFRAGYFGERVNAVLTPRIEERVDVVAIDTSRHDDAWLSGLGRYSFHYAVRQQRALDHFKPFLKGFTAAHCGAPVLIQRDQEEAVRWLGADYPYLLDDTNEETILSALARAESEFGGPRWLRALSVMEGIRARTSPERIASELAAAIA